MISMAQLHRIKWLHEREGLSERKIAVELGISRNTVKKYLAEGEPPATLTRQKSYGNRMYSDQSLIHPTWTKFAPESCNITQTDELVP